MRLYRGRYAPSTVRRWWLGGTYVSGRLRGMSWGLAGRGYYFAVLTAADGRR